MPPPLADLVSVPKLLRTNKHEHLYIKARGFKVRISLVLRQSSLCHPILLYLCKYQLVFAEIIVWQLLNQKTWQSQHYFSFVPFKWIWRCHTHLLSCLKFFI